LCDFGYVALDVSQLVESDAGEYKCRAYNKHGEAFSSISLKIAGQDVLDTSSQRPEGLEKIRQLESRQARKHEEETRSFQKPVFTLPLQNIEKEENQNARFAARIIPVGDATLKVEWFKDGNLLSKGKTVFFRKITLKYKLVLVPFLFK
jgi:titin